jgi:hypothetical protein
MQGEGEEGGGRHFQGCDLGRGYEWWQVATAFWVVVSSARG